MRRVITIGVFALLLISSPVLPQQQAAMGSIEGIVVRADSGQPITGAQVTLTTVVIAPPVAAQAAAAGAFTTITVGPPATAQPALAQRPEAIPPVVTAADGRFSFKNLIPASYRLGATANGFVRQEYAQRSMNGQGRPIFLTAGLAMKDVTLRLPATGTVSGRIFDENGQPATGAPIQLLRPVYSIQGKNFQSVGTGSADDRGDYRIYGVPPGRYYLAAGSTPGPQRGAGGPVSSARFSMVFFPNVADIEQGSMIEVTSGGEAAYDMHLRRLTQSYRVRGRVVNNTGTPIPQNVNVMLSYRTFNGSGSFSNGRNFDPATGTFELQNVAPGDYSVTIQISEPLPAIPQGGVVDAATLAERQAAQASRPTAQVPIHVVDSDIEGLVLTLSTGFSTTGRVIVEGQPIGSIANLDRIRLNFQSLRGLINQAAPAATAPGADGTFQVAGLREGEEYRLAIPGVLPAGLYVKSIHFGGDDVLTKPLKIGASSSGTFEITLRQGVAQLAGTLIDARSQPVPGNSVVLIPNGRTDLTRQNVADQNGHFAFPNLPPGEYKLFSWEAIENNAFFDPEFLKQYEQQAKTVVLTESSNQQVEVRLIPAP